MRWAFAILALGLAFAPADADARARRTSGHYYTSVDGARVHRPTFGNRNFGPVTARCRDGSRSFSHHARGTCSHHGGVASWGG